MSETQNIAIKLCEEIIALAESGASTKDLHFRAKALEAYLLVVRRYEGQG
jgi:hypothetical protein